MTACSTERETAPVQSAPMTAMPEAARAELAPGGRLRAALNYSNVLLVSARVPEPGGVAPDVARELARRAGATVEFVGFENAGLVADAVRDNAWDVAFIGAEPARAGDITFSPAYVEIEATYVVPAGSPIKTIADVDRDGVRVATTARAAYTLYLQRTLSRAKLIEAEGIQGSFDRFVNERLDVLAGLKPRLLEDVAKLPGARILDGRFTAVQQAMGVPKSHTAAAAYLVRFAEEIRTSGYLATLIEEHQARGLSIASQ
jgi:polar amino acid transport system substrate-binding protein